MTAGVVTSLTRPSTPQVGDQIFETDTGNILYWYGPTDGWLPNRCLGHRLLGYVEGNSVVQSSTFAVMVALTLILTPAQVRGRKLCWIANFPIEKQAGGAGKFYLSDLNDNTYSDRNWNNGLSTVIASTGTIVWRESISLTQQINVGKRLSLVGNNCTIRGQASPPRIYNLMCFDEGFVGASASPVSP